MNAENTSPANENATEKTSFRIPERNWSMLAERLAKLAKRADKLGQLAPRLVELGTEDVPLVRNRNFGFPDAFYDKIDDVEFHEKRDAAPADIVGYNRYYLVRLEGVAPTLPGWELLAVVEHGTDSEVGNVLRGVPGKECPPEYRTAAPLCDHCGFTRRRNETFVIREVATGDVKQIGRNCLADFCRSADAAEHLVAMMESWRRLADLCGEMEGECGGGGRRCRRFPLANVLNLTATLIRNLGWTSRSAARAYAEASGGAAMKPATADHVTMVFCNPKWEQECKDSREGREFIEKVNDFRPEDAANAEAAIAWVRSFADRRESLSDYEHNLLVVCSSDILDVKHFGIACSAVSSYLRHIEKLAEASRDKSSRVNEHFGTPGVREEFTLKFESSRAFDSEQWGTRYMVKFTSAGRTAIWWTGNHDDFEKDVEYVVKATVKGHGDYKGWKQTDLSRVTVLRRADEPPPPPKACKPRAKKTAEPAPAVENTVVAS